MFLAFVITAILCHYSMSLGTNVLQQHTILYVFPEKEQCRSMNCNTLEYYAERANMTANSTAFVFAEGNYTLNTNVSFSNLSKITLRLCENCSKPAMINCTPGVGFKFEYIDGLKISKLILHNCSRMYNDLTLQNTYFLHSALFINSISNLTMSEVTVEYTRGYGAVFFMLSGHSTLIDCYFQHSFSSIKTIMGGNAMLAFNQRKGEFIQVEIKNSFFLFGKSDHFYVSSGLEIVMECSMVDVTLNNVTFNGSEAKHSSDEKEFDYFSGGNLAIAFRNGSTDNSVNIKNCTFASGQAFFGAGMYLTYYSNSLQACGNRVSVKDSIFLDNIAYEDGGAVYLRFFQGLSYGNLSCGEGGKTSLELKNCKFDSNIVQTTKDAGVGVTIANAYADSSEASSYKFTLYSVLLDQCVFLNNNNTPNDVGIRSSGSAVLYVSQQNGDLLIKDCFFSSNGVTALAAFRSKLYFSGNVTIYNNTGYEGGGIILCEASYMIMNPNTNITIQNNSASFTGGGIFAESRCVQIQPLCFYQINSTNLNITKMIKNKDINISIWLVNNTADYAGSQLFGGTVDNCHIPGVDEDIFYDLFHIPNNTDLSRISSDPLNPCFCNDDEIYCDTIVSHTIQGKLYVGEEFNISVVTVGQYNGTVPGEIEYKSDEKVNPRSQHVPKNCRKVSLSVHSLKSGEVNITVLVKNQHANYQLNMNSLLITVNLKEIPLGFNLTGDRDYSYTCVDKPNLAGKDFKCLITNSQAIIKRPFPKWLGYYNESPNISGFVLYNHCPINYCHGHDVDIPTNHTFFSQDEQCANNRSGVLCGQCRPGFSLSLGSLNCYNCTNHAVLKTIGWSVLFLFAGIMIVILVLASNFTVTQGTVSELLFYANIVFIYQATLGPKVLKEESTTYSETLQVIVNVINLNYGHKNCFYNGLDLVGRTWLQFILVFYLWILTSSVVLFCRKSLWLSNRIGYNAVPALATILLLSCSPLNLSILFSLTFASMNLPHKKSLSFILFFDGNVPYLDKKHIPLFIAGSIFAVLSLGFTVILLFIQPLQKYSHLKLLRWVNKLKPIFDAYTCPHIIKPQCRFWNGFLLLVRTFLYICYVIIDLDYVLLGITVACLFILALAWAFGGVYTKKHLNIISSSYIINIGLLSVVNTYHQLSPTVIARANSASITIAVATMLCTLVYHVLTQLRRTKCLKGIHHCINKILPVETDHRAMRNYFISSDSDGEIDSS